MGVKPEKGRPDVGELTTVDSYSRAERLFVIPGRRLLLRVLTPLTATLAALGITPNVISAGQLVLGALFIALVGARPHLAFLLFVAALLLDALDGALARYSGHMSRFGALFDQFCDHARETMVVAGLAALGAVTPLIGVLYAFIYVAFNLALYLCNYYHAPLPVAIKSYLLFYPALFLYLWFGVNWLDWSLLLAIAAMVIVVIQGLARLRSAMD